MTIASTPFSGLMNSVSWLETEKYRSYVGKEEAEFGYPRDFDVRYELREEIGRGGYGVVWRARCRQTGNSWAVKVLDKSTLDTKERLDRVRREVLYQAKMGPSLSVAYLSRVFEDDKNVYMVMELCKGGELWRRIAETDQYSEARAAQVIKGALQAVAQCHAKGIIVRDVKPHNFLFLNESQDSPLKLTDFGLAEDFDPRRYDDEPFEERVGTGAYMAPEVVGRLTQWPPKVQYGPKSDVWSVGVMAYQLLCGRLPFKQPEGKDVKELTSADAFAAITLGALDHDHDAWRALSLGAKSFLTELLQIETKDRPSARQALQHRFLRVKGVAKEGALSVELPAEVQQTFEESTEQVKANALAYLQRFGGYTELKQAALQVIVEKHLSENVMRADLLSSVFIPPQVETCDNEDDAAEEEMDIDVNAIEAECSVYPDTRIKPSSLQSALLNMGHEVSSSEAQRLLRSIDRQRAGEVELTSFVAAMSDWQELKKGSHWDVWVTEAFGAFDPENKGFLDEQAVSTLLDGGRGSESPSRIRHIVRTSMGNADTDNDGRISFDEFKSMLETDDCDLDVYDVRNQKADYGSWSHRHATDCG